MRVRDIIHRDGPRLRLSLAPGEGGHGPLIRLSDPGRPGSRSILLDLYGAELLVGFLMSARLSAVGELADECCNGDYPLMMRLCAVGGSVRIELDQLGEGLPIAGKLWDRLYAELQLNLAHGRNLAASGRPGFMLSQSRRLLH
ncbi:hypothetical protein [Sphingomonas humi]|uniref:Uncharacterized protein n=1 Tax=Sphingomonas humi TaxID=335630 RepID=A0ABP7RGZ1_9SPHN